MEFRAEAILLSVRPHGEHGAIVRALTAAYGVQPGYVRGGHARALRAALQPANLILGAWRVRTESQLAALTVEPLHSRAPLFSEPLAAAALVWATALTAAALPDAQPCPRLYAALDGLLAAIEAAPTARGWATALARYELLLLAELGFGLEPGTDPAFVDPETGQGVSRARAAGREQWLLPLPAFLAQGLASGEPVPWPDILAALRLTGHFLTRDLLAGKAEVLAARDRLTARLNRAVA